MLIKHYFFTKSSQNQDISGGYFPNNIHYATVMLINYIIYRRKE
jgi:hypothetical protein